MNGGPQPTVGPPLAELDFDDGYRRFHLAEDALEDHDGRFEFWDRARRTAWEVREVSPSHERPSQRLATLAERISAVRGHPIQCFGTMDLALLGADGKPERVMQADQSLYLHPQRANIVGPSAMAVGWNHYPDVVLEVDRTTDVRRNKLKVYAAWGFPEVWVEVPEDSPRPRKLWGTTIHLLEGGAYRRAGESLAFPGWRAGDIHRALNEARLSERTVAILERVGAALGARAGTGPDDDPLLRSQRRQARQTGRAEGRAEGEAKGRAESRAEAFASELVRRAVMVRHLMMRRGLDVAADFPLGEPGFAEAAFMAVVDAAAACEDEADFLALLRHDPKRQGA